MDCTTLAAYDDAATAFADDWHAQPPPTDLHALIRHYFRPGLTADIGCGSGREVAWLAANGFPAIGYDASEGLLCEARTRYPQHRFEAAALPALAPIASESFDNVLCALLWKAGKSFSSRRTARRPPTQTGMERSSLSLPLVRGEAFLVRPGVGRRGVRHYFASVSFANRSRNALAMTLTEDSDMASAAMTGDSSTPMIG